jgi:hypothetical protein
MARLTASPMATKIASPMRSATPTTAKPAGGSHSSAAAKAEITVASMPGPRPPNHAAPVMERMNVRNA